MKKLSPAATAMLRRVASNVFYPLLAFGIVLAVWAIAAAAEGNPLVLPMPDVALRAFFRLGGEEGFWSAVGWSLLRTLICFAVSMAAALLFAVAAALWKPVYKTTAPIIGFLRAAPTVAVILVLYAFLANRTLAVVVGFLVAFPLMFAAFYGALTGVDPDLIEMLRIYKVGRRDVVCSLYVPAATDCLFKNGGATLSLTLKVVVAAEILTSVSDSIGMGIKVANSTFEIAYLLGWTLVAIAFSLALEGAFAIGRRLWEARR